MKHGKQILILGMVCVILLLLAAWMPQASTHALQGGLTVTITTTIVPTTTPQPIPTIDPKTALELEKLRLEAEKLRNENDWWWSIRSAALSTLAVLLVALVGFFQWRSDHRREQAKLDEERFQKFIEGLGNERVEARVGAAIMLLTFLRHGYEKFYSQTFLLAVAHLRLRKAKPGRTEPLDALSQALITVFKEAFPKARNYIQAFSPENLDATGVHLDHAYLSRADLSKIYMRGAFLRKAFFYRANLQNAYLKHSNMEQAFLEKSHLEEADLGKTNLRKAKLAGAYFQGTDFYGADLEGADLTSTNPENAKTLTNTILRGVKGLSPAQLAACKAKGAIVDEVNSP